MTHIRNGNESLARARGEKKESRHDETQTALQFVLSAILGEWEAHNAWQTNALMIHEFSNEIVQCRLTSRFIRNRQLCSSSKMSLFFFFLVYSSITWSYDSFILNCPSSMTSVGSDSRGLALCDLLRCISAQPGCKEWLFELS